MSDPHTITSVERLLEVYPKEPVAASRRKESRVILPSQAKIIEAAPFCVLATVGDGGLDQSPRGDAPGFVEVVDEQTLVIPDRRGNNRLDTLRNIVRDPRVGLIFLVPGMGEQLRVRGTAVISTDPDLLARHAVKGIQPASVLIITVHRAYFQCARAMKRSGVWDPTTWPDRSALPTAGRMTQEAGGFTREQAAEYDAALDDRQEASLY